MEDWAQIHLITAIINTIFSIFIIFIYIKSKFFHSYAYYFNILFTLVICLRNILRLIQKGETNLFCFIQAFFLSTLDKLIQMQITCYSIINYIGLFKMEFFRANEKYIFTFFTAFSIMYSFVLSTIYISQGLSGEAYCCYVKTSDIIKRVIDSIFSVLLLFTNVGISIKIIVTLCRTKEKQSNNKHRNVSIKLHLTRFITEIIFVTMIFLIVIFSVNKIFTEDKEKEVKEIMYEILLIIMEIFYTMNLGVIKEIKRIVLCQKVIDPNKIEDPEEKMETNEAEAEFS